VCVCVCVCVCVLCLCVKEVGERSYKLVENSGNKMDIHVVSCCLLAERPLMSVCVHQCVGSEFSVLFLALAHFGFLS
jgi:hypothetical protein